MEHDTGYNLVPSCMDATWEHFVKCPKLHGCNLGTKPNMASFLFRAHSASTKRHDQSVNVCYRTNFISNLLCPAICNPHFFGPVSIFLACFHPSPVLFFLCSFSSPCEVSPFHMPVLPCMFSPLLFCFPPGYSSISFLALPTRHIRHTRQTT